MFLFSMKENRHSFLITRKINKLRFGQLKVQKKNVIIICKNSLVQYFLVIKIGNFKVKCLS